MKSRVNRFVGGRERAAGFQFEKLEDRRMLSGSPFGPLTITPQPLQGEVASEPLVNTRTSVGESNVRLAMIEGTNFSPTHTPTMIVRWGDGSKALKIATQYVSPTEVSADISQISAPAGVTPLQAHAYKRPGDYHIHVELIDGKQTLAKFSQNVQVAENSPLGQTIVEKANTAFTTSLGSFQGMPTMSAISAQINWGDGQTSAATVSNNGNGQVAAVVGSHTYAHPGKYRVSVTGLFEPVPPPGENAAAVVAYQAMFSTVIVRPGKV